MSREAPQFELEFHEGEGVATVMLSGSLDASSLDQFRAIMSRLCARTNWIILLDCKDLNYICSSTFGLLAGYHADCVSNGNELVIYSVREKIAHILRFVGLTELVKLCVDRESALKLAREAILRNGAG